MNCHKEETKYADALNKKDDDFDVASPMSNILKNDDYQDYLNDLLEEGVLEKISKLVGSSHIKWYHHISPTSEAYNKVNKKDPPKGPTNPSCLPNSTSSVIDVGKDFDQKNRFDPDSINATILAPPPLYAYVMSTYSGQSISDVIKSKMRIDHLNYYLHFHNRHGDTNTIKKVHIAFAEKYNKQCDTQSFWYFS